MRGSWLGSRLGVLLLTTSSGCFGFCGGSLDHEQSSSCVGSSNGGDEPAIVIGTNEGEGFRALEDGAELEMDYGPQGGQHVYVSYRVFGSEPDDRVHVSLKSGGFDSFYADSLPACGGDAREVLDDYVEFAEPEQQSTTIVVSVVRCSLATQEECANAYDLEDFAVIVTAEVDIVAIP
jgi:hypothetical protein